MLRDTSGLIPGIVKIKRSKNFNDPGFNIRDTDLIREIQFIEIII